MVDGTVQPFVILAESQAIVEYVIQIHGQGRVSILPGSPEYVEYLFWYNFANGSLQACLTRIGSIELLVKEWKKMQDSKRSLDSEEDNTAPMVDDAAIDLTKVADKFKSRMSHHFGMIESRLTETRYIAGHILTAADIMTVFSLTTMRGFLPFSLVGHKHILRYLEDIAQRPAYRRAMEMAEPDFEPMIEADVERFVFGVFE